MELTISVLNKDAVRVAALSLQFNLHPFSAVRISFYYRIMLGREEDPYKTIGSTGPSDKALVDSAFLHPPVASMIRCDGNHLIGDCKIG